MPSIKRMHGAIAACLLVAAGSAYADEPTLTDPANQGQSCEGEMANCPAGGTASTTETTTTRTTTYTAPPAPMAPPPAEHHPWYEGIGYGLSAGGGVSDFASGAANDATGTAGDWNVRLTMGTRQYLALEALYIGSAQSINAIGLSNGADLIGNGVQADLRVNLTRRYPVQPFIYSGGAWRNYQLTNDNFNVSDVANSANVFELPLGGGIAGYYHGFMADARGEYRWAWGDDIIAGNSNLSRWNVSGNVGVEF